MFPRAPGGDDWKPSGVATLILVLFLVLGKLLLCQTTTFRLVNGSPIAQSTIFTHGRLFAQWLNSNFHHRRTICFFVWMAPWASRPRDMSADILESGNRRLGRLDSSETNMKAIRMKVCSAQLAKSSLELYFEGRILVGTYLGLVGIFFRDVFPPASSLMTFEGLIDSPAYYPPFFRILMRAAIGATNMSVFAFGTHCAYPSPPPKKTQQTFSPWFSFGRGSAPMKI